MTSLLNDIQAFIDTGNSLLASGEYDKAELIFLEANTKWPENPHPYIGLAHTAHFKDRYTLSLERWKIAHGKFPGNFQILTGLGNVYLDLKNFEKANKYYAEANELSSNALNLELDLFKDLNELV